MENPFVLISSGLLVQPDEGVSDLVVDRIGVTTAIYREEPEPLPPELTEPEELEFDSFLNCFPRGLNLWRLDCCKA
ncbi:hypothetical protein F511_36191 [Dorcoceras hygrometricum]|uniref:Uncharacterized protein n=1 Tax=Dorcoceras hygrometricum TaxID=472368 RepID=A0A2Z7C6D0_9LAMI|nr:hypothetical protein F511_36191 [Dorcoceras hygrometricum]